MQSNINTTSIACWVVINIRDPAQRRNSDGTPNKLPDMPLLSRDNRLKINIDILKRKLNKQYYQDKQLLIFDATGEQVRWLQYTLERQGYRNYYFLKGGVYSVSHIINQ
ncbi:MAG: hypothetical protein HON68_07080 [Gammaproteobacteria bacterium]|jgi:rhodanese-related sulfurtransferase|nr:hypothetical protein [Gammaproteobacteria bacterium]MBT3489306.1 hypothetical protein [Gammaproteobacteria bacterium]MBT3718686.1 hypothetical protein [Gammaproteobacteria bacterium]MBT3843782.1 hypothetical protein [Gammaproteobacteria bacterium]MBT3893992.1 hypothetical protein [Gammaproteobacteria bacterium]